MKARCATGRISFMFKDGPTQALAFGDTACVLMCTDVLAKGAGAEISNARTTAANGWRRGDPRHLLLLGSPPPSPIASMPSPSPSLRAPHLPPTAGLLLTPGPWHWFKRALALGDNERLGDPDDDPEGELWRGGLCR